MNCATRNLDADRFLPVEGARLRFRDEGAGFPVVFIHGWTLDLEMWAPQANAFRDRFRVVRMDRRGFGASSGTPSLRADLLDLEVLFNHLGLQRATIVGMSQGARVAMHAVKSLANRLVCLVLDGAPLDNFAGNTDEAEIPIDRFRNLVTTQGLAAFRSEWLKHPLMRLHNPHSDTSALLQSMLGRYAGHDLTGNPEEALPAVRPADIRIPTLVLNGALDHARRRMGDALFSALPHAQRAIIAAAGHLPNLDCPHEYNEALRRFIQLHELTAT